MRKPNGGEEEGEVWRAASRLLKRIAIDIIHTQVCRTEFGVRAALEPFCDLEVTFEGGSNALV